MRGLLLLALAGAICSAEIEVVPEGSGLSAEARQSELETRWQARQIAFGEGRRSIADLVAELSKSGLDLRLDASIDPTLAIDHPGFTGDAWGALIEICAWYDLRIMPGAEEVSEMWWSRDEQTRSLPWQSGTVILSPIGATTPPPMTACGPLLVQAHRVVLQRQGSAANATLELGLRLRPEPRHDLGTIGDARVQWEHIRVDGTDHAPIASGTDANQVGVLLLDGIDSESPLIELRGTATLQMQEPLIVNAELSAGDTTLVPLGTGQARIQLLDRDQARELGKRAACVIFTFPSAQVSGRVDIAVHEGDQVIASQGSASRHDADADSEQIQYLAGLGAGPHKVTVRGLRRMGVITRPVALTVDTGILPRTVRSNLNPGETATHVTLPGGTISLGDALRVLRSSGNEVLVDLGVTTTVTATVPAQQCSFWEAALIVCEAFDLDILAPHRDQVEGPIEVRNQSPGRRVQGRAPFHGGPLRLGPRGEGVLPAHLRMTACGPLLVEHVSLTHQETLSLDGATRMLIGEVRVRLEPALPTTQASDATVWWAGTAADPHGTTTVRAGEPLDPHQGLMQVILEGAPGTVEALTVSGMLSFRLQERISAEVELELGKTDSVLLGSIPVSLGMDHTDANAMPTLTLSYARDGVERLEPVVTDSDGATLSSRGRSSRGNQRTIDEQWTFPGLVKGKRYRVTLSTTQIRSEPTIPIRLRIAALANRLPDADVDDHLPAP